MNTLYLDRLPKGKKATVVALADPTCAHTAKNVQRLQDLGFLPGQTVKILQRGLRKTAPLAVMLEQTLWALRHEEARCIQIRAQDEFTPSKPV